MRRALRQWSEPIGGGVVAVIIEICNGALFSGSAAGWVLGIGVASGGLLLGVQRMSIEKEAAVEAKRVRDELKAGLGPLRALSEYVDLAQIADYQPLKDLVNRYASITETEFSPVKRQMIEDAIEKLRTLATNKRSPTLRTADYYDWLFTQFGQLKQGEYVHAISLSSDEEWNESELEKNFLKVNINAGSQGVDVSRIFVVESSRIAGFLQLPPIDHHTLESDTPLIGYLVRREELTKYDPMLLKDLNEGFIDFNGRVGLQDKFNTDGEARGDVTMLPQDLKRMNDLYTKLMKMATPLSRTSI